MNIPLLQPAIMFRLRILTSRTNPTWILFRSAKLAIAGGCAWALYLDPAWSVWWTLPLVAAIASAIVGLAPSIWAATVELELCCIATTFFFASIMIGALDPVRGTHGWHLFAAFVGCLAYIFFGMLALFDISLYRGFQNLWDDMIKAQHR